METPPLLTLDDRLILACVSPVPDAARIAALVGEAPDWPRLLKKAERWGLMPLVDRTLRQADGVPADVSKRLRNHYHRDTVHGLGRRELLRALLTGLAAAGLPAIVLKGVALAAVAYPEPALRPMRDIDLLVRAADRARVDDVVQALRATFAAESDGVPEGSARNPYLRPDGVAALDISVDVIPASMAPRFAPGAAALTAGFWARAQTATIAGCETLVLSPDDLLLHVTVHLVMTGFGDQLRALCDLAAIAHRHRDAIDWPGVVERAATAGLTATLHQALHLATTMLAAEVPVETLTELRARAIDDALAAARHLVIVGAPPPALVVPSSVPGDAGVTTDTAEAASTAPAGGVPGPRADRPGEVAVTHDQSGTDGVGSQLHRIWGMYALARGLGVKYVHSGFREINYQGLMPMIEGRHDTGFTDRYNAFYTLPSDDFDVDGCDRVQVHSLDQAMVERYQARAAEDGRSVLIRAHLPYAYVNYHPASYQVLRTVSPYRGHRPTGPVRVCLHVRRGDNSVQERAHEPTRPLGNDYFLRLCDTVVAVLRDLGLPFVIRLHTEQPPRPYTLHPGLRNAYFKLDTPSKIDPADSALHEFERLPNLEMVVNVEPRECLDDFATADLLVLSLSSLGFAGGVMNPHGCVISPERFHAPLPDWIVATREGIVDEGQVRQRLTLQLRDRA